SPERCRSARRWFDVEVGAGTNQPKLTIARPSTKKETDMKFLCYTMGDDSQGFPPPTPELFTEMDKFIEETVKAGVLIATGGLALSATGTKVTNAAGKMTVTDGPFSESKEIIGGFAMIEVASKDEAIGWTKRFLTVAGDGESTIRQYFGPDDEYPFAPDAS
ncbi:MAG: YciI family protein, partial [Tepidiformaceae bacterium]